jgi:hypothetical protein
LTIEEVAALLDRGEAVTMDVAEFGRMISEPGRSRKLGELGAFVFRFLPRPGKVVLTRPASRISCLG